MGKYTAEQLNAYLISVREIRGGQTAEVDEAWRQLGFINASAFKGYRALSEEQAQYNAMIYGVKEQAIRVLVQHTDNVSAFGGVLYIRTLKGIQISFHLGATMIGNNGMADLHQHYLAPTEWDGVENAYTYSDIEAYNEARSEYRRKRLEDAEKRQKNIKMLHEEVQNFFIHHSTRRLYGLPTKKSDWQAVCKEAISAKTQIELPEYMVRLYGIQKYNWVTQVAEQIERNLPAGWDNYNFS